ncbi:MAG: hypothetical protein CUN56_04850 [Phototrophicales bacterium]|nr:MAG: hypothetical protein CUN56_04850 [Phototrophicales bacterium]RMG75967.1 MAG: hypothetical protein D6711_05220 [Chloroflexota bacterium]
MSRARERQKRRIEQRKARDAMSGRNKKRTRSHLAPAQSDLPEINLNFLRPVLLLLSSGLFMAFMIILVGLFAGDEPVFVPNALWLDSSWTYQSHDDEAVQDLVNHLRDYQITILYAKVSELNFDATWTGLPQGRNQFDEVRETVRAFAAQLKSAAPDIQLYGVLSIRADLDADGYRLDDPVILERTAQFASQVVHSYGYDGVMLVIEPVWDGDTYYLDMIRAVRESIGDQKLLAVAVPPDWTPLVSDVPITDLIAPNTVWSQEYKQRVMLTLIDQLVVQAYNSYLTTQSDYAAWVAYQTQAYGQAVIDLQQISLQILIGVPAYESIPPAHDANIETITAALIGIKQGESNLTAPVINGIAIYAEWGMTETQWQSFKSGWLEK